MRHARLLLTCLLVATLGLGACKRNAGTTATAASDHAGAPTAAGASTIGDASVAAIDGDAAAADLGEFRVVSVLLGDALDDEHIVRAGRTAFAPRAVIHASVLSTGMHPGLTLAGRWRAPDGRTILESGQPIAASAPATSTDAPPALATTFTLRNDAPWPAGDYAFELRANGHLLETTPFTVR